MKIPIALLLFPCASLTCAQTPSSRSLAEVPQASVEKPASAPVPARPELPKPELRLVSPVGLIDERVQKLHATVDLTAEQQKKVKAVLVKNDQALQTAAAAFRSSRSRETRQALAALMKAQNNEISALLTDAQKTKCEAAPGRRCGQLWTRHQPHSGSERSSGSRGASCAVNSRSHPARRQTSQLRLNSESTNRSQIHNTPQKSMKARSITILALLSAGIILAQGPLTPPAGFDPKIGPANALDGSGLPQATMKTLHQVEPRTPLAAGQPGVTQNPNGGFTITLPGSYYLTASFGVSTGSGIVVEADYVTLDLNGMNIYSYASPASGAGVEVPLYRKGLTVRNGFIVGTTVTTGTAAPYTYTAGGFTAGVLSEVTGPTGSVYSATLENLDVRACSDKGIWVTGGRYRNCFVDGCGGIGLAGAMATDCSVARCGGAYALYADVVTRCEVLENNGDGIQAHSVDQSVAFQNGKVGFWADLVTNCKAELNAQTGIIAKTVRDCVATDNLHMGIYASSVSGSTSTGNFGTGIEGGAESSTISDCTAIGNGGFGIWAASVSNSTAFSNDSSGIVALNVTNCASFRNSGSGITANRGTVANSVAQANTLWGIECENGVISHCNVSLNNLSANVSYGGISCEDSVVSFCRSKNNGTVQYFYFSITALSNR
jgi:hypothetical protein